MIKVAIIDSGVVTKELSQEVDIIDQYRYRSKAIDTVQNNKISNTKKNLHGSAVAEVILQGCSNIGIIDVNILDEDNTSSSHVLLQALKKTIELKPDIVHLSLGTVNLKFYFKLKRCINELLNNNIIVVAAYDNSNKKSYPADFKGALGVKNIELLDNINKHEVVYLKRAYYACPYVNSLNAKLSEFKGTSISAARVTGMIANYMDDSINFNEITFRKVNNIKGA